MTVYWRMRLEEVRTLHGLSVAALARAVDEHHQTVNRWMHGRLPAASKALRVAKSLGHSIDEMIGPDTIVSRREIRRARFDPVGIPWSRAVHLMVEECGSRPALGRLIGASKELIATWEDPLRDPSLVLSSDLARRVRLPLQAIFDGKIATPEAARAALARIRRR